MRAKVNTQDVSSTVKAMMVSQGFDGVTGDVTATNFKAKRVEVTFTHNNRGDETNQAFWFDFNQVFWMA